MDNQNLQNLQKIAKIFQPENIITSTEIDQVLKGIVEILASYKKGTDAINEDTKQAVNTLLEKTIAVEAKMVSKIDSKVEDIQSTADSKINEIKGLLEEVKTFLEDVQTLATEVKDGKDADEEKIVEDVISRIKIDPTVVTVSAEEVKNKLESLKGKDKLDISAINGFDLYSKKVDLDYAVKTLQHQTSTLINRGGVKSVVAGTNVTVDNTDPSNPVISSSGGGGSGSPGGLTTQLQYNNAGSFGGISGATTNGTAVTYTTGNLIAHDVKASQSAGIDILSSSGTVTALFGAGGGANSTFYGGMKGDYLTASEILITDASKNIVSAAVATYPSLTELTYLKGVTSAIQTQLNAKGAGTVTSVTSANADATIATTTTTPVITIVSAPKLTTARTIGGTSFDGTANISIGALNSTNVGATTSAELAGVVSDETGTGALVFANAPALVNPTATTQSDGDNTTKVATTAFVTTAVANGTIGLLDYRGSYDASTNLFPATGGSGVAGAILKGDFWMTSVGGTLGGTAVTPGDLIIALVDTPAQTAANWDLIAHDLGSYVTSITGTANQVIASASTGAVTLSLPQSIATSSNPQFATLELGAATDTTISRVSAGVIAVEGVTVDTISAANTLTNKTLTTPVINGLPTGTGVATAATVSTLVLRDTNGNTSTVNSLEGYTTTATAAGTTTLTVSSNNMQYFTGSTTQTVAMPVTSTLVLGQSYWITNLSTGLVTINSSGGNAILILAANTTAELTCILTSGTTAASWNYSYIANIVASGKKATVNKSITFTGTHATTMTLPTTSATIARTDAANTFTGVQTMTSPAITTATLSGANVLAENASIQLDPAGSADGKFSGITVTGVAGYAQAFGDLVYLAVADSRWELADADASATAGPVALAMVVVAGGSDGAACTLLLQGIIRADAKFPTMTIGATQFVGETAGAIQGAIPTGADNVIRTVGYALTADALYFNPSTDWQITVA